MSNPREVGRHLVKAHIEAQDSHNKAAQMRLSLLIMALISFLGCDIVKIFFRKNMGKNAINMQRIWLAATIFFIIAALLAYINVYPEVSDSYMNLGVSALGYLYLGVGLINIAYVKRKDALVDSDYEGDSVFGDTTIKDQAFWKEYGESFCFITAGISFAFAGIFLGIGLIFIGLSVWIHRFMQTTLTDTMETRIDKLNAKTGPEEEFHEVIL